MRCVFHEYHKIKDGCSFSCIKIILGLKFVFLQLHISLLIIVEGKEIVTRRRWYCSLLREMLFIVSNQQLSLCLADVNVCRPGEKINKGCQSCRYTSTVFQLTSCVFNEIIILSQWLFSIVKDIFYLFIIQLLEGLSLDFSTKRVLYAEQEKVIVAVDR